MAGFGGFGTGSTGGGLFGAKPPEQSSGGFTMPTTTTITTTTSGLTFGAPTFGTGVTGGLFGTQQQTSTFGTSFGAKPATGTTGPIGLTFGTPAANTNMPTFGTPNPNTSLPTFGSTTTTTNLPTFGSVTTTTNPPTFGSVTTTTALPTFGSFGTSNTSAIGTTGFSLGAPKTIAATGFTLPSASTATAASTSAPPTFSFGLSSTTTMSTPLTLGLSTTTAATSAPTLSFGVSTAATTSAPTLTFGVSAALTTSGPTLTFEGTTALTTASTTQPAGFTLNPPSTTTSLSFGVPKTTGGLTFGTGTTTFGTPATTTASFNLGATTTTAPTLATGLFGTAKTTENVTITTTTATTSVGLGGIDNTQTTQGLSGSGTLEPKQAKDHNLPDPILQTLNEFQNFTKQQKSISVEISHGSSKPLKKVQEDTEAMESLLTMIARGLTRNAIAVDKLKTETAQGLHQAEMAQRNHETPPGLDYDNSAPADYFNDLVTKFETDTVRLGVQIEASEKHLKSLTQSSTISPQELTLAMRRLHETLIVLAARVQALHTSVQSQKEQYKNLRRVYFKDDTNIFENDTDASVVKKQTIYSLRSLTGPTPFSETPGGGLPLLVDGLAMLANSAGASIPTTSSNPSWMSPLQGSPNTTSILPGSNLLGSFQPLEIPGFQLSKPPTGNKRSKR